MVQMDGHGVTRVCAPPMQRYGAMYWVHMKVVAAALHAGESTNESMLIWMVSGMDRSTPAATVNPSCVSASPLRAVQLPMFPRT